MANFVIGTYYPEYASGTVPHSAIPWSLLTELWYFGMTPKTDYSSSISISTNDVACQGHPFTNDQAVQLRNVNGSATPTHTGGALAYDTNYFVRDVVAGISFKLALTAGGAALDFTAAGVANGRRWKAPQAYLNRFEFAPGMTVAACNDLIAKRDAQNPNCKVYLVVGRDHSNQEFIRAIDYAGGNGLQQLTASIAAIVATHGFDGIVTDFETFSPSGSNGLGGDGRYLHDLHEALRNQFGSSFPLASYLSRSGPAITTENWCKTTMDAGYLDFMHFSGYAMAFPGSSQMSVTPHCALHHHQSDHGTPVYKVGMVESVAQFTGAGVPIGKIVVAMQAGGVPWVGGVMTSTTGPTPRGPISSTSYGARYPNDRWAGGGTAPTTPPEVTYRNRATLGGSEVYDQLSATFFISKTGATASQDLYWASENPVSAAAKRAHWQAQGAAGVGLWQLGGDDVSFSILNALNGGTGAITVGAFSSRAQGSNAKPWPSVTHALGASADMLVAIVASIGSQTFTVTAGGVAMTAGPVAGPAASGANGFTRAFYLLADQLPAPGNIAISVNPSAQSARGAVGIWSLIGTTPGAPNRHDTDLKAVGPSSSVSLANAPAGAICLTGMCNNKNQSRTTSSGMEVEGANFDGAGGNANQVFGHSTPDAAGTITHSFTSPGGAGSYISALMLEILPAAAPA